MSKIEGYLLLHSSNDPNSQITKIRIYYTNKYKDVKYIKQEYLLNKAISKINFENIN